jgi:hypothetical protein
MLTKEQALIKISELVDRFTDQYDQPSIAVKNDPEPSYQLRRYGWSAKMAISLINKLTPTIPYFKPEEISELLHLKKHYTLNLLSQLEKRDFVHKNSMDYIITEKGIDAVNQKRLINEAKSKYNETSRILIELIILIGGVVAAYFILSE